jgi:hypothetical protein
MGHAAWQFRARRCDHHSSSALSRSCGHFLLPRTYCALTPVERCHPHWRRRQTRTQRAAEPTKASGAHDEEAPPRGTLVDERRWTAAGRDGAPAAGAAVESGVEANAVLLVEMRLATRVLQPPRSSTSATCCNAADPLGRRRARAADPRNELTPLDSSRGAAEHAPRLPRAATAADERAAAPARAARSAPRRCSRRSGLGGGGAAVVRDLGGRRPTAACSTDTPVNAEVARTTAITSI